MHLEDLAFEDPINVLDLRAQTLMLFQQIANGMTTAPEEVPFCAPLGEAPGDVVS